MVKVNSPKDIVSAHRYLIFIFKTRNIHYEGDERSRTNPGHGYPAHDEQIEMVEVYAVVEDQQLESDLRKLYEEDKNRKDILVIKIGQIIPVGVSLKIDLGRLE